MEDLLAEYSATKAKLEERLRELKAQRVHIRGGEAILLGKRIEALEDEIRNLYARWEELAQALEEAGGEA